VYYVIPSFGSLFWVWCTHLAVVQCQAHAATAAEQAQHWQPPTEKLG